MPKFLRPAAPRLIHSHPLAVGLADAVLLDGDRGWNFGNEGLQPAFAGAMTAEWTGDSPGSRANGTSSNYATLASTYNIAAGAFTVSVLWKPVSHSLQFVTMLEKASGSNREWAFFVRYNGSTSLGNVSYYTIGTTNSGDVNLSTTMTDGGTYRFTATRDASNTITMYVNGISRATGSSSGTTAVSGSAWQIGRRVSGATSPNAVYGDLFVWPGRCLSADEVLQHATDPWEMLRPPRRFYRSAAVADVSLTGVALTSSAGTLGIDIAASPAGIAATASAGAASVAMGVSLSGAALTVSAGSLAYSIAFSLTGEAATSASGTLTGDAGGYDRTLTGIQMTALPGNVRVTGGTRWAPQAPRAATIAAADGNTLPPPPRLTGNLEADTRAMNQWLATFYDQFVKAKNVLGRIDDHETRIAALEADDT